MSVKERIAIIDDDVNLRKTLADILAHYGHEPLTYPNGQSVMQTIAHEAIGVALLDLRLEDCSGLDVLRFIREHSPNTACIILTGHASQTSAIEAVNAGAYSYFLKPVNIEQLLVTIRRAIEKRQADFALVESERQYQALAEVSPVGIFRADALGNVTYVNPRWSIISGMPPEQAMGQGWLDAVHPEDIPHLETAWQAAIKTQQASMSEYRFCRLDGDAVWVLGQALPEFNSAGQFIGYVGTITDITTRKQTEAAIKRHLADLEILYENGLILARLFERKEIAQRTIELLEQHLNWHHIVVRLSHPEKDEMELLGFSQAGLDAAQVRQEEQRLKATSIKMGIGLTGWAWQNNQVVRSGCLPADSRYLETFIGMQSGLYVPMVATDRVLGVVSVESERADAFSDADERLLVTVAAQATAAFENARLYAETVHRLEELDTLVQVSAAMRTAASRAEMLPVILEQTMAVLRTIGAAFAFRHPATNETVFELGVGALAGYTQGRVPYGKGITSWVMDNGEPYVCQDIHTDPLYSPPVNLPNPPGVMAFAPLISQNQIIGVLLVGGQNPIEPNQVNLLRTIANIAANAIQRATLYEQTVKYADELEQRVEERTSELRTANVALERASRSKDEFLASMSHELRTPLTGILNLSEVLQEQIYGSLNEKQLHYVHVIEESGRHLLGLINDILDLSKIEAGQFDLQLDLVQLDVVCQACIQLTRGLANKKNQPISYSIFPPGIILQADPRRLKQMLVNLLSNAVKFTPPGGKIGLEVTGDEQDQVIHFTVWDTGIGIAEEDFSRLFRPFSQLDGSLSRQHEGTGLGLAIAQRLADKHGGGISLESRPGQGSRFTIHIPWVKDLPELESVLPETKNASQEIPSTATTNRGIKRPAFQILLADDNQVNVEIYAEYLRQHGYQVILAGNGKEALELAHQVRPNLILMDIQMPGMDGLTAIRQLRALEDVSLARTPVIALTALAMPGDRERCLQAGADDYLGKPVSLRDLLRVIQAHLK
jgi:PAS domain S-box-containing protein